MDFMSDQLFDGRRIRILAIVDAFSLLSPAIDVRQSYRGSDVVETPERVTRVHGMPRTIRVDNGLEFISKELDLWAWMNGVTLDFSRPDPNVARGKRTTMSSVRSARSARRKPRSSWPLTQGRHADPEVNQPGFSRNRWSNKGVTSSPPHSQT